MTELNSSNVIPTICFAFLLVLAIWSQNKKHYEQLKGYIREERPAGTAPFSSFVPMLREIAATTFLAGAAVFSAGTFFFRLINQEPPTHVLAVLSAVCMTFILWRVGAVYPTDKAAKTTAKSSKEGHTPSEPSIPSAEAPPKKEALCVEKFEGEIQIGQIVVKGTFEAVRIFSND